MKFNPIKIKPMKIHFRLDTDRDRVPDWKDCRPFNPRLQHISKTTEERIKIQPIFVSDIPGEEYHVLSKDAKQKAPRARQEMLSAIKKYPSVLGEFERSKSHQDSKYRFVHKSFKRPSAVAQEARESMIFDKLKMGEVGIQPEDSLRQLKPFAERYRVRQAEMEEELKRPYEPGELPPEAFDMPLKQDEIKTIRQDSFSDVALVRIKSYPKSKSDLIEGTFKGDASAMNRTLRQLTRTGLIQKTDDGLIEITLKGREVSRYLDNHKLWKNPYYYAATRKSVIRR